MRLYNTLTRKTEPFQPRDHTVGMYVCGPTVYDHIHIGNVRPILVFDTLRRYFERWKGWRVLHVQNITDVDDKLIARSIETGVPVGEIARTYTEAYFDLLDSLDVLPPTHSPRATEHISGMIELIVGLVEKGFAYECEGDVYFRVGAVEGYGKLSGRRLQDQEAGARVEAREAKENPLDFTLWKASKPGEPNWPSPWGDGRPGWHTECVVLSHACLGDQRDIHAGGNDLVFPHHENEIAQAEALGEVPFFRFWMHNGMLSIGGEKMSKSKGNFEYAKDVLARYDAETVRYFYLSRHYRKPLDYSEDGLQAAHTAVSRIRSLLADIDAEMQGPPEAPGPDAVSFLSLLSAYRDRFAEVMDEDLNTVAAIGVLQELASETNRYRASARGQSRWALQNATTLIRELGSALGLPLSATRRCALGREESLMSLLVDLRAQLREKREFAMADQIRDQLAALGILLKDTPQGTIWTDAP
jgi:cysteinyl-tRNA synthetase